MIIYKITNSINDKVYIGQTNGTLKQRFAKHKCERGDFKITRAFKKYGIENFKIEQIDQSDSQEEIDLKEKMYIQQYDSVSNGYNTQYGGRIGGNSGRVFSAESRKKMSESKKGMFSGSKHPMWGKKQSVEFIERHRLLVMSMSYLSIDIKTKEIEFFENTKALSEKGFSRKLVRDNDSDCVYHKNRVWLKFKNKNYDLSRLKEELCKKLELYFSMIEVRRLSSVKKSRELLLLRADNLSLIGRTRRKELKEKGLLSPPIWLHTEEVRQKSAMTRSSTYTFIDPNGKNVQTTYLPEFCNKNNLSYSCMLRVAKGERTLTVSPPVDFESTASTDSATQA